MSLSTLTSPASIISIIVLFSLLVFFIKMRNSKKITTTITAIISTVALLCVYTILFPSPIPTVKLKSKLPSLALLGENTKSIFSSPLSIFAIIGLLALLIFFIRMKKVKFTASMMTKIAMAVALTALLNAMQIAKMPQGGSITPGSMIPLIFIALIYGTEVGVLAGFLFGIVNFIMGPFILNPVQVLFDYPLAFMLVGLAGLFKDTNKQLAVVVGMGARWLCHVISGVVFFSSYAGDQNPIIYSMVYNASYMIPETIIALVVISALPILRIKKAISYNR